MLYITIGCIIFLSLNISNHRKKGDGLFLGTCEEVSKLYPKIQFESMIVDNCCMQVCKSYVCSVLGKITDQINNVSVVFHLEEASG